MANSHGVAGVAQMLPGASDDADAAISSGVVNVPYAESNVFNSFDMIFPFRGDFFVVTMRPQERLF